MMHVLRLKLPLKVLRYHNVMVNLKIKVLGPAPFTKCNFILRHETTFNLHTIQTNCVIFVLAWLTYIETHTYTRPCMERHPEHAHILIRMYVCSVCPLWCFCKFFKHWNTSPHPTCWPIYLPSSTWACILIWLLLWLLSFRICTYQNIQTCFCMLRCWWTWFTTYVLEYTILEHNL